MKKSLKNFRFFFIDQRIMAKAITAA
jgi:hypothetical protein